METFSLYAAALTMYSGMFYVTGQHYDYMNNDTAKYFLLFVVSSPNIIFVLYWLHHMRIELMKELFKKKFFFLIRFLNIRKYNEDHFYDKILKHDEAFQKTEEDGKKVIKYVGVELH